MRRILVIHPNLLVRNALIFSLQHSGFRVVGASGGEEALTEVNGGHLDVIVVAESSHRLNGDELGVRLRQICQCWDKAAKKYPESTSSRWAPMPT